MNEELYSQNKQKNSRKPSDEFDWATFDAPSKSFLSYLNYYLPDHYLLLRIYKLNDKKISPI